jgi:uncharacterized MAPEG superfamily protein
MTIAYWCVLAAGLMPFLWTIVAKVRGERFNNRTPREWQSRLSGLPARAHAAHLNAFEAFPLFAAAVIIADRLDAPQATVDWLALAFIAQRVLYGLLYLADQHALRSLVWFAGIACTVAIFVVAS